MYDPNEYARAYRANHREECKEASRKATRKWYEKRKSEGKTFYFKERQTRYLRKLRQEVLAAYGSRCACCGETGPMFLELDHINNDGAKDRRFLPGNRLYFWLKRNDYPEGYQVLCANCNRGKYRNGGICPHNC